MLLFRTIENVYKNPQAFVFIPAEQNSFYCIQKIDSGICLALLDFDIYIEWKVECHDS